MKVIELTTMEARVIGCLIEKQITTPDQYPLSLNSLVSACNQKSNRDPMMDVDESTVQRTLDDLGKKHLILERSGFGSRVPKYQHRFCNTEFGTLKLSPQEVAIVCELLLRGPQTPGELRPRAGRMATFTETEQVEATLEGLRTRDDGPFVVRLARQAGRRDSQWAQLFTGAVDAGAVDAGTVDAGNQPDAQPQSAAGLRALAPGAQSAAGHHTPAPGAQSLPDPTHAVASRAASIDGNGAADALTTARIDRLESEVRLLREELDSLKKQLGV